MLLCKFAVLFHSHEYALITIVLNHSKQFVQKSQKFVVYLQKLQGKLLKQFVKIFIITTFTCPLKKHKMIPLKSVIQNQNVPKDQRLRRTTRMMRLICHQLRPYWIINIYKPLRLKVM